MRQITKGDVMKSFIFQTTKSVICGSGCINQIGTTAIELGMSNILLVTDQGIIKKTGILNKAFTTLKSARLKVTVVDDVVADPPEAVILKIVEQAKEIGVDGIIGFGGGSPMDVAKLVAFLSISKQSINDIYGVGMAKGGRLPLIQVPTTAGTGSEVTPIAIVTTGASEKKGVVSPVLLPDAALLDAELTTGLPPHVTAATGIDAMVHAIEAYTSKNKKNIISDNLAKEALALLSANIKEAVHNGSNIDARENMLLGAMLAGQSFANSPVAAVHALAYPIGGHFHVPHGLSNSLVLTHVMKYNLSSATKEYAQLAQIMFPEIESASDIEMAKQLIKAIEKLIVDLKLENRLSQVGITENDLDLLASDAMKQERLLGNNPKEMTKEAAYKIYSDAL